MSVTSGVCAAVSVFGSAVFLRRVVSDEVARARFGVAITDLLLWINSRTTKSTLSIVQLITIARLGVNFDAISHEKIVCSRLPFQYGAAFPERASRFSLRINKKGALRRRWRLAERRSWVPAREGSSGRKSRTCCRPYSANHRLHTKYYGGSRSTADRIGYGLCLRCTACTRSPPRLRTCCAWPMRSLRLSSEQSRQHPVPLRGSNRCCSGSGPHSRPGFPSHSSSKRGLRIPHHR